MFEKLETLSNPAPAFNRPNQVIVEEQEQPPPPPESPPPLQENSDSPLANTDSKQEEEEEENPSTVSETSNHTKETEQQGNLCESSSSVKSDEPTSKALNETENQLKTNINNKLTNSTNQHNNYQYINSVKKSAITSLSLCSGLKRLKKKARLLGNQNFYTNKYLNKYASYSSSSPSSSVSSSSSSCSESNQPANTNYTSSSPLVESNENKTPIKQKSPMKLHKFYHSVPFKCPFCFTFKEIPSDFINHLATVHYSDVKILYEKRCHKLMSKKLDEKMRLDEDEGERKEEESIAKEDEEDDEDEPEEEEDEEEEEEEKITKDTSNTTMSSSMQQESLKSAGGEDLAANLLSPPSSLSSKLGSYSLPPRKQQRLLRSPLNQSFAENTQQAPATTAPLQQQQQAQSSDFNNKPTTGELSMDSNHQNYFNYYCKSNSKHLHPISHHHHFQKAMHKSAINTNQAVNNNNKQHQEFLLPSSPSYMSQEKKHLLDAQQQQNRLPNNSVGNNGKNLLLNTAFASILNHQNQLMKSFAPPLDQQQPQQNQHQHQSNMNTLGNEASMKCAICDRGFEYYSNLRRHIKTKHKIFGKQVKEYVIRHNFNNMNANSSSSSSSSSSTSNSNQLLMQRQNSSKQINSDDLKSDSLLAMNNQTNETNSLNSSPSSHTQLNNLVITNSDKNGKFSAANSDSLPHMNGLMSPSSSTVLNKTTTTNYTDAINKSSNGKNSPLSSMSSSSIGSAINQLGEQAHQQQQQANAHTNEQIKNESLDDEIMDQDEVGSSTGSSSSSSVSSSSSPVASLLHQPSSLLYSPSSSSTTTTNTNSTPQMSTAIPSAPKAAYSNNLNSTVAAIAAAAAAAASGMNPASDLNSSLMAAAAANSLVPPHLNNLNQMASLFTNHANAAMSKIKSSLLESLLSRKLPNKYLGTDMNSIGASSSVMPPLANDYLSQMTNDLSKKDSKMANLNKLLQNIVEMNQFNQQQQQMQQLPFNNLNDQEKSLLFSLQNQFKLNSLNQFGVKSNEFSQQEVENHDYNHHHHHQCAKPDCNCANKDQQECNELDVVSSTNKSTNDLDESNENNNNNNNNAISNDLKHNKKRRYCHNYSSQSAGYHAKAAAEDQDIDTYDDDLVINQADSNEDQPNGQEDNQNHFYEDVESELDEERDLNETSNNNNNANRQNNETYEDELRTRSRSSSSSSTSSNSSKSGCSSSLSSMLMNQIAAQTAAAAAAAAASASQSNKLLLNGLVNCMSQPPMNQSAFESLKQLSQRGNILGIGGQANNHHHHSFGGDMHQSNRRANYPPRHMDDPSLSANNNKRKKSKDLGLNANFSNLASNPQSIAAAIRSLQCSPNDTSSLDQSRMEATSPSSMMLSLASNMNSSNQNGNNQNANQSNNQIRYSSEIWRCPYCCYETTSASRYNSHLVCHGWKPYLCPHCGSRSNRLPDMRTHISTFHPEFNVNTFVVLSEEEAKSTLKDYMKNRALINRKLKEMRPQPKFKCKLCPYASLYQFNLTKHVKSVHLSDIYNNKANNANDSKSNNMTNNSDNTITCSDS